MIVPAGVLVPLHNAAAMARALRLLATTNGGLPESLRAQLAAFDQASLSVGASAVGSAEVPQSPRRRNLRNVQNVGTRFAAERLGITERGVRDLCERGSLVAELVGRRWLITPEELDAYANRRAAR